MEGYAVRGFGLVLMIASVFLVSGCGQSELTPEQKAYVAKLESELTQTKQEIGSAEQTSARYSGGIIKLLASSRIEILKTNQALLEQRISAVSSGAPVKIETVASEPNETLVAALSAEIQTVKADIESSKAEAARYNGGLIQMMKLSTVATTEQTLAMLQQRYLVAKYGLNPTLPSSPVSLPSASVSATTSNTPEPQLVAQKNDLLPPADGPFGFAGGLSKDIIEKMIGEQITVSNESQNLYRVKHTPKSNSAFETFALVISPTVGLCQIRAIGKTITTNRFGHQLKSDFDELKSSLASIYGVPKTLDMLMPGSIWKDPDDWMMGLYKKDRNLMAEWEGTAKAPLKNSLESVVIEARALGTDSGFVMLQYSFTNQPQCDAEEKSKAAGSL